ncbi:hypothetical protein N2152v2_009513 [Parachlorella kessleri]
MLQELGAYSAQMKKLEKDIRGLKQSAEAVLKTTKETMGYPLPRVYEDDAAVGGQAARAFATAGGGLSSETVSSLSLEAGRRLEEEVFTPLVRWQTTYSYLSARNRDLEKLRLEMGSRQRTVDELAAKVDSLRSRVGGGDAGKAQSQLDKTTLKLQHKQGKLIVAQEQYARQEEELHQKLAELALDSVWIRNCASAALSAEGNLLSQAGQAVGLLEAAGASAEAQATGMPTTPVAAPGAPTGVATPVARSQTKQRLQAVAGAPSSVASVASPAAAAAAAADSHQLAGPHHSRVQVEPLHRPPSSVAGSVAGLPPSPNKLAPSRRYAEDAEVYHGPSSRVSPSGLDQQQRHSMSLYGNPFVDEPSGSIAAPPTPSPAPTVIEAASPAPAGSYRHSNGGGSAWGPAHSWSGEELDSANGDLDAAPAPPRSLPRPPPLVGRLGHREHPSEVPQYAAM